MALREVRVTYSNGKDVEVFDNGGKTIDRFTVFINVSKKEIEVYGMSSDPLSPQGFNQFATTYNNESQKKDFIKYQDVKKVSFDKLPEDVKKAIKGRLN